MGIPPCKLKQMKYSIMLLCLLVCSCRDDDVKKFKENCPYELSRFTGHYLRIPITITPHKLIYKVGDTININTVFSDSIYDLGTQQTFQIEGFPFKPTSLLFRFTASDTYDSGYRVNELHIDSIYSPYYWNSSIYADGFNGVTIYEDNQYRFESELILKEKGRYILLFSDLFQDYGASGNADLNAEADAIRFEGQCIDDDGKPLLTYYLCSMIDSGDDHLELFEEELIYLDEEVYRGKLGSIESSIGPLRSGSVRVEFSGFFGFEVVE